MANPNISGGARAGAGSDAISLRNLMGSLKTIVVSGDSAANTALTATGIRVGDMIQSVIGVQADLITGASPALPVTLVDHTANATITGKDTIQVSVATTDENLMVTYWDLT